MTFAITPTHVGIAAGAASALAFGLVEDRIVDGYARRHPTGSDADTPGTLIPLAGAALGFVSAGVGMFALSRGSTAGAALIGVGAGAMLGSIGAGIAFRARHGVGVDSEVASTFSSYNRDFDDVLDLNTSWRTPEYVRRVEREWEDSDGRRHHDVDYYTIARLSFASDSNHDGQVTRPEMRSITASFDRDNDGRLKGNELGDYKRQYGEESWWGNWDY